MCVKLPSRDLNPGPNPPSPSQPTSTNTCEVTITLKVCMQWYLYDSVTS